MVHLASRVIGWIAYRVDVVRCLEASGEVPVVIDRLAVFAPLEDDGKEEMERYCHEQLATSIATVDKDSGNVQET